jgi:hypothetical protein
VAGRKDVNRLADSNPDKEPKALGREGLVTVYDDQGRYLGCMGVFLWQALLDAGSARKDSPCR